MAVSKWSRRWPYFRGVMWKRVRAIQEKAEQILKENN